MPWSDVAGSCVTSDSSVSLIDSGEFVAHEYD